ncbi:hypothetical protein D1Z97_04890 [Riemerella anatipestifer]|uniref:hypothetical protein n=1 Tax=Riemerella anatipestifer TaxID=34085 RepID=UPI00129E79DA|nr:hypothetical protein [Riemerella anatipestifer]MRM97271.1 hypothetical protein [Riemerella anatipestifer]MRN00532.1 hypothetical protein [Riemerella anatipestifer]MRN02701.1 hypothetical protein [Riemerella anatipestifer]
MNIQVTDLTTILRHIPEKKKYSLLFGRNNSVSFTSKRKAFEFLSKVKLFLSETLVISEMVYNSMNLYKNNIVSYSPALFDEATKFHNNDLEIYDLLRNLKYFRDKKRELHDTIRLYENLIFILYKNAKILEQCNPKETRHILLVAERLYLSFSNIVSDPHEHYKNNSLTLFNA